MIKKKTIYFILPTLGAGGAERVISYVCQNLNKEIFSTKLIIIGKKKNQAFDVDSTYLKFLEKERVIFGFYEIIKIIRKEKPDIVVSAATHLNGMLGILAYFLNKTLFIGREVNVQSVLSKLSESKKLSIFKKKAIKWGYKNLDMVICQSDDMLLDVANYYEIPNNKLIKINNPISEKIIPKSEIPPIENSCFKLITVGRLAKQKGHSRILKCLSKLDINFVYTIIGDGPEKNKLFQMAEALNLTDKINHIPFTNNVFNLLAENHVFLQGSYVEGFPNALLESCAIGTPVIAFNALGGINEIVSNDTNGFICKDEKDFILKIGTILQDLNKWPPEKVANSVYEKFSSNKIFRQYEKLFLKLLEAK